MNRLQFCAYLRNTLIPDLRAAEMDATAEDFETALQFITEDMMVLCDCKESLERLDDKDGAYRVTVLEQVKNITK